MTDLGARPQSARRAAKVCHGGDRRASEIAEQGESQTKRSNSTHCSVCLMWEGIRERERDHRSSESAEQKEMRLARQSLDLDRVFLV